MTQEMQIESYLTALRYNLGPLTIGEREEIVLEIGAHIRDSAEEPGASIATVLARLGPAEKIAAQYRDGLLIRKASHSFSPLVLLRGTLRLATKGVFGVFVFFCAVFGYAFGAASIVAAFAKTIVPAHTGAWVQDGRRSPRACSSTVCRRKRTRSWACGSSRSALFWAASRFWLRIGRSVPRCAPRSDGSRGYSGTFASLVKEGIASIREPAIAESIAGSKS